MTKQETMADKIAKLLLKAESTTPEEAEELYQKAQELMAKYAIDEAMLEAARGIGNRENPIIAEEFVNIGIYRFPLSRLTFFVMKANGLECIQLSDPGWREVDGKVYKETEVLVGVGYQNDVERVKLLRTSLMLQAMRAEAAWWKKNKDLYESEKKFKQHRARRGFLFAFADGAYQKLHDAYAKGKKDAEEEHGSESVALVLRDKSLAVKNKFEMMFPDIRKVKDRKDKGDAWARANGYEAGQKADVGTGGTGVGQGHKSLSS